MGWQPIETAPHNDTMVRLLVDYSADDGDHALDDAVVAWTIGFNSDDNTDESARFALNPNPPATTPASIQTPQLQHPRT